MLQSSFAQAEAAGDCKRGAGRKVALQAANFVRLKTAGQQEHVQWLQRSREGWGGSPTLGLTGQVGSTRPANSSNIEP